MIRLGVVGCGRVTESRHLPALRRVPSIEVVALADVDEERLHNVAGAFGVAQRYTDYRALVEDKRVDAVAVCVPPALHSEIALATISARKHVFIEKPLALTLGECDLLSDAASRADSLTVMVGFNMRWHRLVREARERVRRGDLGKVKLARTLFVSGVRNRSGYPGWRRRRESGGGAILELGVHHFDLLRFVLGSDAREVYATSAAEDEAAVVSMIMSRDEHTVTSLCEGTGENHELEIYGERGWLRVSCYRADGFEQVAAGQYPGSIRGRVGKLKRTLLDLPRILRQARMGGDYVATYREEWRHFAHAVSNGRSPEATIEDGRHALEIALAAWVSTETKRAVSIVSEDLVATTEPASLPDAVSFVPTFPPEKQTHTV